MGGRQQKSGQQRSRQPVGESTATRCSKIKIPQIPQHLPGKDDLPGSFLFQDTKGIKVRSIERAEISPLPVDFRWDPIEGGWPNYLSCIDARRSATVLPLLWSLGWVRLLSLPPICRPKQKKKAPWVVPSKGVIWWADGSGTGQRRTGPDPACWLRPRPWRGAHECRCLG